MGNKILLLRIFALITVIMGVYSIYWFIFSRITQVSNTQTNVIESEVNAPRLNKKNINDLTTLLEDRKTYAGDEGPTFSYEDNPFLQ